MGNGLIKVLLIEDDPDDALLIQEFLSETNRACFQIEIAEKLCDGLGALAVRRFDVVLIDLFLPDSLGLETLTKVQSKAQQVSTIVLTGLNDEDMAIEAVRKGAQDYLMKGQIDANLLSRAILYAIERKRIEEEKKKLEAQLQRARKMEAIGTLAGGVAHDLNNILAGLVGYPELLLLEIPQDSPLRKSILAIQKAGEKAATVVHDLLTMARRGIAVAEVVNFNNIISEYMKSLIFQKVKLYNPETQIETNLEKNLLNIVGSPVHLSKVVMNLVANAAESMPGGGKILISTENRYIDKPIRGYADVKEGDYVTLIISDSGMGISSEDMERIFEPFYTKKVMGRSGTGLGMAVVWGTVKDHKGYIDIQSTIGEGTTFTLYFPASRKELTRDKSLLSIKDYMSRGESILIVDDVEEQRDIASRMLKKLGYSVTSVSSGEQAVDYMKDNSVDLLVLDMIMEPGIDGLETYKRIIKLHPGQKAIIVSGFSETESVKEAQRLGAGDYLKKPYLLEKIGLTVRSELDK